MVLWKDMNRDGDKLRRPLSTLLPAKPVVQQTRGTAWHVVLACSAPRKRFKRDESSG
jgi:hypothetical protein